MMYKYSKEDNTSLASSVIWKSDQCGLEQEVFVCYLTRDEFAREPVVESGAVGANIFNVLTITRWISDVIDKVDERTFELTCCLFVLCTYNADSCPLTCTS
uniref:Peptidase S1 domain-containing protein n=1 Tax=Trichuris muris TaxID=70415 RepID=A0A5S6QID0_TRIMR